MTLRASLVLASTLASCLLAGCGGTSATDDAGRDAPSIDAPPIDAPGTDGGPADGGAEDAPEVDAGTDAPSDAPASTEGARCLFHTQCDEGQLCLSPGATRDRICTVTESEPGPLLFEESCPNSEQCASGVCYSTGIPGVEMRCSQACETDEDCGEVMNDCREFASSGFYFCTARL